MEEKYLQTERILAIDPTSHGFGYAILEGNNLIDWGTKGARENKNQGCLDKITFLIDLFRPDILVVEDVKKSRRCDRIQNLICLIQKLSEQKEIQIQTVSYAMVRETFSQYGAHTKHEIALAICEQFPILASRIPPIRKPWLPEDERMAIFDAVAMVLCCQSSEIFTNIIRY